MSKIDKRSNIKMHPVSTLLLVFYVIMFIVQGGSLEVFAAGLLAASAAYILETIFVATGAIRTK